MRSCTTAPMPVSTSSSTYSSRSASVMTMRGRTVSEREVRGLTIDGSVGHGPSGPFSSTTTVWGVSSPSACAVRVSSTLSQSVWYWCAFGPTTTTSPISDARSAIRRTMSSSRGTTASTRWVRQISATRAMKPSGSVVGEG